MNYTELFLALQKQIKLVDELISRTKTVHTNVRDIYTLFNKINKKLDKLEKK